MRMWGVWSGIRGSSRGGRALVNIREDLVWPVGGWVVGPGTPSSKRFGVQESCTCIDL